MTIARQIVLAARPKGKPRLTDLRLEETAIPTPASGQLLLGVQYLSLDPYMRGRMDDRKSYAKPLQLGDVMTGESVAQVLTSKHPAYAEGDIVLATGWRTYALSDGTGLRNHARLALSQVEAAGEAARWADHSRRSAASVTLPSSATAMK